MKLRAVLLRGFALIVATLNDDSSGFGALIIPLLSCVCLEELEKAIVSKSGFAQIEEEPSIYGSS